MKKTKGGKPSAQISEDTEELKTLKELVDQVQEMMDSIMRTRSAIETQAGWSAAYLAWKPILKRLPLLSAMSGRIEALETLLSKRSEQEYLELESNLREACAAQGWKVDGQWPKLFIERAISVEIHEKDNSAIVGGSKLDQAGVARIVSTLKPIVEELIPRGFSAKTFIEKLSSAYDQARGKSAQAPILEVYRVVVLQSQKSRFWKDARKQDFVGLSLDQFRARLSRALEETNSYTGRQLRLLPPLDPKDAIFLYQPSEARFGFVGRIEFVPTEPGSVRDRS